MIRLPATSSRSSRNAGRSSLGVAVASSDGEKRLGGLVVGAPAGTETSSRSGQRSAVSFPPNTQPVSMLIVLLSHSGSATGVCPYTTVALPR